MSPEQIRKPVRVIYPTTDGKPMANGTEQYDWIVSVKGNLDIIFWQDDEVFIAGDLFWYPVEGNNKIVVAPDILVALGRPRGDRGAYLQWKEGGIAPQVVFEILSPSNTFTEMAKKFAFFQTHGVEEYYVIRPDPPALEGWTRRGKKLVPIKQMDGWVSPRLKVRFSLATGVVTLHRPDGTPFLSPPEIEDARQRALLDAAESARQKLVAQKAAAAAKREAVAAQKEAVAAQERADRLAARLRALGIDPDAA